MKPKIFKIVVTEGLEDVPLAWLREHANVVEVTWKEPEKLQAALRDADGLIVQAVWDFPNWDGQRSFSVSVPHDSVNIGGAVPEPATMGLLGSALAALAFARLRRRRSQKQQRF